MNIPKVFISYSHDSQDHKKWVLELATRLRNNGIDAIIDQFELRAGDDLPHFMENNLASADKIIMICSERYVDKANNGEGGVGYEKMIITSNLLQRIDENKIIPIIRQNVNIALPTFMKTKLYINFSKDDDFEYHYDDLVRTIHKAPLFEKPPVGNNPFTHVKKENLDGDKKFLDKVLKTIADHQGTATSVESSTIVMMLGISAPMFKIAVIKLNSKGYTKWAYLNSYVAVTEKGLLYAYENNLIE